MIVLNILIYRTAGRAGWANSSGAGKTTQSGILQTAQRALSHWFDRSLAPSGRLYANWTLAQAQAHRLPLTF